MVPVGGLLYLFFLTLLAFSNGHIHHISNQHHISFVQHSVTEDRNDKHHHHPKESVFEHLFSHAFINKNLESAGIKLQIEIHSSLPENESLNNITQSLIAFPEALLAISSTTIHHPSNRGPPLTTLLNKQSC